MSINLDNVTAITHNNKDVIKIEDSNGNVIWNKVTYFTNLYANTTYNYVPLSEEIDAANKSTSSKTWNGLSSFDGNYIWSDGTNIYYSGGSTQYVLDVSTSTWTAKTWNGLATFDGTNVWYDGTNFHCDVATTHYILDLSTSTWSVQTWNGFTGNFTGKNVWSDGTNIYLDSGSTVHYVLDVSTSTWVAHTWNGLSSVSGGGMCKINNDIYYISSGKGYKLDVSTSTFGPEITVTGWNAASANGDALWFDGTDYYFYYTRNQQSSPYSRSVILLDVDTLQFDSSYTIDNAANVWTSDLTQNVKPSIHGNNLINVL